MAIETFPDSEDEMTDDQKQRYYAALSAATLAGDSEAYWALRNRSILKKAAEPVAKPAKQKPEVTTNEPAKSN